LYFRQKRNNKARRKFGTTYHITYLSDDGILYKKAVDSLLALMVQCLHGFRLRLFLESTTKKNVIVDDYFKVVLINLLKFLKKGILILPWGHWLILGLWTNDKRQTKEIDSLVNYKMVTLKITKL
jgi:thiamine biosynthesis lipoprotein